MTVYFELQLLFPVFSVIYDSCPRSYSGGIWWPRTLFENIAEQDCPEGSFGKWKLFPNFIVLSLLKKRALLSRFHQSFCLALTLNPRTFIILNAHSYMSLLLHLIQAINILTFTATFRHIIRLNIRFSGNPIGMNDKHVKAGSSTINDTFTGLCSAW